MANRTIQSPGVEIRESDLSLRTAQTGTTTYIAGFASEGPTDEVIGLGNISEFEQIYGTPKTPAERYFYHSARAALNSTGSLLVNRLPYGANSGQGFGSNVSVLAYPAVVYNKTTDTMSQTYQIDGEGTYVLGRPTQFNITGEQYLKLKNGQLFEFASTALSSFNGLTDLSGAAVIVVNKAQTVIDNQFNGYYVGLTDNILLNPATNFDAIQSVFSVTTGAPATGTSSFTEVPASRFEFSLTATPEFGDNPANGSISQVMEDRIEGYDIGGREFDDALNVGVFRLRQSVFSKESNKLDYLLEEGYNASIGKYRQRNSENGGAPVNFSLDSIEEKSDI